MKSYLQDWTSYELDLQETLLAGIWERALSSSHPRASDRVSRKIFATRVKYSPLSSWLRHDSVLIQAKLPARQAAPAFHPPSPPVDPQWLCWYRWGFLMEMPAWKTGKQAVRWQGGISSHKKPLQEAQTLTLHLFHIKNLYKSVTLKIFPSFPASLTLFGKRHMELIMNKGQLF